MRECHNEEDLNFNEINLDSPELVVITEGNFHYCFVVDQIYEWLRTHNTNPYTRREIPEDRINEIRNRYNDLYGGEHVPFVLRNLGLEDGRITYQVHDDGKEDYTISVDPHIASIVDILYRSYIRPEQVYEAISTLENIYDYYTYDQTEENADRQYGDRRDYLLSKRFHHAVTDESKAEIILESINQI